MLIRINKSKLFTVHPSKRFANEYQVKEYMWNEMWNRYRLLDYSIADLADYFYVKTAKPIKRRHVKRWIFIQEIYNKTTPAREMGAEVVNTEIFGDLEDKVIEEVTRHLKYGDTHDVRIMA
jgi:hypothetical protein